MPALTKEQLAARRKKIGGSECSVALNMNPWCSPLQLFAEKMEIMVREQNEAMGWGHYMEDVVAQKFADEHPSLKLQSSPTLQHNAFDWIIATPDRICLDDQQQKTVLLQIKNVGPNSTDEWGDPGTDEIPDYVACQVQWEMGVVRSLWRPKDKKHVTMPTMPEKTVVGACLGGQSPRWYEVAWDEEFFDVIRKANEKFVKEFLIPEIAPPMDYASAWSEKFLQNRHKHSSEDMIEATDNDRLLAEVYRESRATMNLAKAAMFAAKVRLEERIGDHGGIEGDGLKITWKEQRGDLEMEKLILSLKSLGVTQETIETFRAPPSRVFRLK